MSRISSLAANTNLIQRMLRTQMSLLDLQAQVNSGKKSRDYAGIARNSERLINVENTTALLYRYIENNDRQQTRLNVATTAVQGLQESIKNFKKELTSFKQQGNFGETQVKAIQDAAFRALRNMEDLLNTEVDGRFIFSGGATRTEPVDFGVSSLADFQAQFDGQLVTVPTTRDSQLESYSFSDDENNRNKKYVDGSNFLQFRRDGDGDATTTGSSTIRATSALFADVAVGSTIEVTNTASNNGTYTVTEISSDGTTATVKTKMLTDETLKGVLADETPVGTVSFLLENNTTATSGAGNITFDQAAGTITDAGGGLFSGVSAGDFITISGSTSNNGTVKVQSVDGTNSVITVEPNPTVIANSQGTASVTNGPTGDLTFSRSGDTITAATANAFANFSVGDIITVSGTDENDGTYTVTAKTGTQLTVESKKLTDEGLSGSTFYNYFSDTDLEFTNSSSTIEVRQSATTTAVADIFVGLQVGDQFTVTGTASNNGTYTIASIASDGSSVTVEETLTDETFQGDGALAGSGNGFAYNSGTQMVFTDNGAGSNTIQLQNSSSTAISGVFSSLKVGETITVKGTDANHNGTYTINAISSDGSQITVAEAFPGVGGNLTDTDGAELEVFAADGTVSASSYYSGNTQATTHRVDDDRDFEFDTNAVSPGFEKAIRAIKLIMQGEFGTEGGLDQNTDRVSDALYLLGAALETTVSGTPPFGTEEIGSIEQIEQDIGFNQYLIEQVNTRHNDLIAFLEGSAADVENADPLESITKLLDERRALEASYQAFARVRQLSLTNFL